MSRKESLFSLTKERECLCDERGRRAEGMDFGHVDEKVCADVGFLEERAIAFHEAYRPFAGKIGETRERKGIVAGVVNGAYLSRWIDADSRDQSLGDDRDEEVLTAQVENQLECSEHAQWTLPSAETG